MFFEPFHALYTAGLHTAIAPQDAHKSPVSVSEVIRGALRGGSVPDAGYNATFAYPRRGLNHLAAQMARFGNIEYNKRVVAISPKEQHVHFADGESVSYGRLLSTLPLSTMMAMCCPEKKGPEWTTTRPDPSTSVLVVNIGAVRGRKCPAADHWVYVARSRTGFHRIGIYSNVDRSFLPGTDDNNDHLVSLYVESAYTRRLSPNEQQTKALAIVEELIEWEIIESAEVIDPTWIDVAYTWSWPGSRWRAQSLHALRRLNIFMVGRYGQWHFQGIADSIRDGLAAGAALRTWSGV
jgi:protoporphyrinogen oxidase